MAGPFLEELGWVGRDFALIAVFILAGNDPLITPQRGTVGGLILNVAKKGRQQ